MKEYFKHLEFYKDYPQMYFSNILSEKAWGNEEVAKKYLEKYWLSESEYLKIWKPIQAKVFLNELGLPYMVFNSQFNILATRGGCLFNEEDYNKVQDLARQAGDEYLVVVQRSQEFTLGEPMFRMKYPVNTSWAELTSGNYISAVLLDMSHNEYYVFGSCGLWGRYSANDYDYPVDIIGYDPELANFVKICFKQRSNDIDEIKDLLPLEYKDKIHYNGNAE